jgi:histidinol-phosphate/aromatic aminotransferase/cobyric acid decarboxylase-like protein/CTP:phosphocholine cytidylyltransferase-like protein
MQALILAAGYGRRMRPLTDARHKTLLPIGGGTIIDRILDGLAERSVTPITIVTGYRRDELVDHVAEYFPSLDVRFVHNAEYEQTNNIHSMALAFEEMAFDDDVLLIESDLIYEPRVLDRLLSSPHENVALVDHYRAGMDGTVVTLGDTGLITQVIPPSLQPSDFSFTDKYKTLNIYRFGAGFCKDYLGRLLTYYTRAFDRNCYYELILGILIYMQQAEVHADVIDDELWAEVDDPNDLRIAEFTFNPDVRYDGATNGWGGNWSNDLLDFAFIRNMHFPPSAMLSELRHNLPDLLHNYGSRQDILDQKLAWALQWPVELVHAVAGASQCYPWLRSWFGGHRVLIPEPTFGEYSRIFPEAARYTDPPGLDWDEIERKAGDADVVVFVNPNNPTGSTLRTRDIADFAARNPATAVIVDESFLDFSGEPSIVAELGDGALPNVLVIKSLSKSLGVPGLRTGVLLTSDPDLGARIREETPIWNLSSVAENFLEVMLKHRPALEHSFERTAADRDHLTKLLAASPLIDAVYPSGGDFLLVRLTVDAAAGGRLARAMAEQHSVLVKDASAKMGDGQGYWRLAVRRPEDHLVLMAAIDSAGATL